MRYWRRATALSPSVAASYAHFAQVPLLAAGDYQGAVHLLRMGIERGNHVEVARGARRIAPVVARFDPAAARDVWFGVGEAAPRDLLARAQILTTWGERDAARATFDSLRVVLLDHGDEGPAVHAHEGWRDAYLAVAEAGIGEPKRAIRRARRAVARLPVERDAYVGPEWLILLATTYTMTGDHAAAIETLEAVLSAPAMLSPALLRLDPTWDPLRSHPRFRALADEPDPTLATEQGG